MKKIILLLIIIFSFSACEKDDICNPSTVTTPRVVLEFYDYLSTTTTPKNVTNLKAIADGVPEGVVFDSILPSSDPKRYLAHGNKIKLPLYTPGVNSQNTTTTYRLINNFGNPASENTDILTFTYNTNTVFVSRACGYKSLFYLRETNPIVPTEPTPPDGNWIKNIIVVKSNIEDEYAVHVKIYF